METEEPSCYSDFTDPDFDHVCDFLTCTKIPTPNNELSCTVKSHKSILHQMEFMKGVARYLLEEMCKKEDYTEVPDLSKNFNTWSFIISKFILGIFVILAHIIVYTFAGSFILVIGLLLLIPAFITFIKNRRAFSNKCSEYYNKTKFERETKKYFEHIEGEEKLEEYIRSLGLNEMIQYETHQLKSFDKCCSYRNSSLIINKVKLHDEYKNRLVPKYEAFCKYYNIIRLMMHQLHHKRDMVSYEISAILREGYEEPLSKQRLMRTDFWKETEIDNNQNRSYIRWFRIFATYPDFENLQEVEPYSDITYKMKNDIIKSRLYCYVSCAIVVPIAITILTLLKDEF